MAITYTYEPQNNIGIIKCSGEVTIEDRYACIGQMIHQGCHPKGTNILINVSLVDNSPSPSEVSKISRLIERFEEIGVRRVAILNTTAGHLTISHFVAFQVGTGAVKTKVFMLESKAREWLNS